MKKFRLLYKSYAYKSGEFSKLLETRYNHWNYVEILKDHFDANTESFRDKDQRYHHILNFSDENKMIEFLLTCGEYVSCYE